MIYRSKPSLAPIVTPGAHKEWRRATVDGGKWSGSLHSTQILSGIFLGLSRLMLLSRHPALFFIEESFRSDIPLYLHIFANLLALHVGVTNINKS